MEREHTIQDAGSRRQEPDTWDQKPLIHPASCLLSLTSCTGYTIQDAGSRRQKPDTWDQKPLIHPASCLLSPASCTGHTACKSLDQDTVKGTLLWGKHRIGHAGIPGARLEAEVLLAHSLGWTRSALLARLPEPLNPEARMKYFADIDLRINGYPLQYITGYKEFMSLPFAVAPGVLIPRPETEMLVEAVLNFCRQQSRPLSLVDVGTGSGAIAISLAHYLPGINVYASDLSPAALDRAKKNASALKAEVVFIEGDLLSPWLTRGEELSLPPRLEAVVSNPPYIPTGQLAGLQRELAYEPALALDGGPDGLEVYRRLIPQAAQVLAPGGMLALETGWDQAEGVAQLIRAGGAFSQVLVLQDLAGKDRVLTAIKNG